MTGHWTEKLFIEAAGFYGTELERQLERTEVEVEGLSKIFLEHGVKPEASVLDLACGIGRHSVALAEKGYRVVGVDFSPEFIARAQKTAEKRGVDNLCHFIVCDIREIAERLNNYHDKFDVALSMFTSMGYYTEETDKNVIHQVLELTTHGGFLVIDIINRDWLVRHFRPSDVMHRDDGLIMIEERKLNMENSRMESVWRLYREEGGDLEHVNTFEMDHRVYSLHEMKRTLGESGWMYKTCYGGFDLKPFTTDTNRMVLVAQRP